MLVAVLGHRGMLGRRVMERFPDALTFEQRYDKSGALLDAIRKAKPDWIINCIAVTDGPQLWQTNAVLPHLLDEMGRLIQPSTDHYLDATPYAVSKHVGEAGTVIRCAIVDPDGGMLLRAKQADTVGETRREWNGVTAKTWSQIAAWVVDGTFTDRLLVPGSPTITHYDLLETARLAFGWGTETLPDDTRAWRAYEPNVYCPPIGEQLREYL